MSLTCFDIWSWMEIIRENFCLSSPRHEIRLNPCLINFFFSRTWQVWNWNSVTKAFVVWEQKRKRKELLSGRIWFSNPSPNNTYESPIDQLFFSQTWQALSIRGYLPAIKDFKECKVNFQRLPVGNGDIIVTVHAIWIVAWISGTFKFVVLRISTS